MIIGFFLVLYLPYLTYILQPFNISIFKPLLIAYLAKPAGFMDKC